MPKLLIIRPIASMILLLLSLIVSPFVFAQDISSASNDHVLTIGTKVAEPFAMKDEEGKWYGISIELWEKIAKELNIKYRWQEHNLSTLLKGISDSSLDVGIAAITITSDREKQFDFSHAYYSTGLSIAIPKQLNGGWRSIIGGLFSLQMLITILMLVLILFGIGMLAWLFEKKKNPKNFNPNPLKGIPAGIWWAAVTMTTVGYGDMTPKTLGGRLVALFWMFASLLMISTIIASMSSALTIANSTQLVSEPEDLPKARIASIKNSSSDIYLKKRHLKNSYYPSVFEGLSAIEKSEIDAMVYDAPLLQYLIQQSFKDKLMVLDTVFEHQSYAIAFPEGSPLRESVNRVMLDIIHRDEWQRVLQHYLGG